MMTVEQAAAELGISVQRVRVLCRRGRIPAQRFGARNWLILSVEGARNRPAGRPKRQKSEKIATSKPITEQGLTTTAKRKGKKSRKVT